MPFATTALIAGGLAAAGGIGGAALSSSAASNAAQTQANAANNAAQLQYQAEQNALNFQESVWNQQQKDIQPWLQSGTGAMVTMDQLMGLTPPTLPQNYGVPSTTTPAATGPSPAPMGHYVPMGNGGYFNTGNPGQRIPAGGTGTQVKGTMAAGQGPEVRGGSPSAPGIGTGQLVPFAPWTQQFTPPTAATEQNDPGYQFRLNQGEQALQNSAAARGDILSGNTLRDITQYGQDYASNEYQNVYNRALQQYQQNYNIYQNNQANQWNRLASMAGLGQTAVGQLNSAGSTAESAIPYTIMSGTNGIANSLNNAAAATASGYVGSANAWGGALGSLGNLGTMIPYLNLLNNNSSTVNPGGTAMTYPAG